MQFKFEIDLDVTGVTVTQLTGYAVIETNEFDPDDGWSIGDIVLDGLVPTGNHVRPLWRDQQVTLPEDGAVCIGNALSDYVTAYLIDERRDEISEKFEDFLAGQRDAAGEIRFERDKHEVA